MAKETLGLIGAGAFGSFIAPHLAPHFEITVFEPQRDISNMAKEHGMKVGTLVDAACCEFVLLAVPVQQIEEVCRKIGPHLKAGTLVMDVASVKVKPTCFMNELLPANVDVVGTHPLFGPQSGKNGIAGLKIAVCDVRGSRGSKVARFLADQLKLKVYEVTAEEHDRQLAYVHGLTHMLGKVIVSLDLPEFQLTTKTYDLISQAVEFIRYDSDELFRAIERENPFAAEAKEAFFAAARRLEERLLENS